MINPHPSYGRISNGITRDKEKLVDHGQSIVIFTAYVETQDGKVTELKFGNVRYRELCSPATK
jgi:hypothetical protein